jgi:thiol-disulfide isomerase/thioredoxin
MVAYIPWPVHALQTPERMKKLTLRNRRPFPHALLYLAFLPLSVLLLLLPPSVLAAESSQAPDFKLPTRDGTVALDALRGRVVLVDFWASWCGPCRQSFPWMTSVAEHNAADGLVIVAINLDKSREPAEAFLRRFSPPFIVAFDPAGKTAEAYDVTAMPSSYLVGRDGRVVYRHAGFDPRDAEALEKRIKEAIAQ